MSNFPKTPASVMSNLNLGQRICPSISWLCLFKFSVLRVVGEQCPSTEAWSSVMLLLLADLSAPSHLQGSGGIYAVRLAEVGIQCWSRRPYLPQAKWHCEGHLAKDRRALPFLRVFCLAHRNSNLVCVKFVRFQHFKNHAHHLLFHVCHFLANLEIRRC